MAGFMTDVYTYDSLANKYGNFQVPAFELCVNGKDAVEELNLSVLSMDISLASTEASTAVIRIGGVYDLEKRSFDSKVKNKLKLGTIVEVGIGYLSEIRKVLKGFVAVLGAEFAEEACLVVTVMDVRRLMMINGTHHKLYNVKNYSDAVRAVLGEYSKLCKPEIDATSDNLDRPLSQQSTDYDFITKELIKKGLCEREFLVVGDTAYFRKPHKETRPVCSLEYGRELWSFQMESSYVDVEIEVTGYNQEEQKSYIGKAKAKSREPVSSLSAKTPVSNIVDEEADNQNKVNARAQIFANMQVAGGQNAKGTCVGLPELVPGRFVEVSKLEAMANRKYYLKRVNHRINEEGFVTEFETGGWA